MWSGDYFFKEKSKHQVQYIFLISPFSMTVKDLEEKLEEALTAWWILQKFFIIPVSNTFDLKQK